MTDRRRRTSRRRSVRRHGTGSITAYDTKAGTRWRFQVKVPVDVARPEIGDRKHSRAGFTSYEAADAELTLLRADLMRKVPQPLGRDTFAAYGQRWLDGHAVGNGTRMYIQRVLDAMDPYIGSVPMADIRATDLAAAYRGLEHGSKQTPSPKRSRKGLATSTVARYANWVNTIFLAALDEGIVARNPANSKHSGRPRGETAKRVKPFVIWNVEQLTSFCDWALADDEPWARAWILLSRTGLRSGELLALRWGDIDVNKSEMRIERALHYDETLPVGERYVVGSVKGGRPRIVSFDRTCTSILDDWRKVLPGLLAGGGDNVTPLFGLRAHEPLCSLAARPRSHPVRTARGVSAGAEALPGRPSRSRPPPPHRPRTAPHPRLAALRSGPVGQGRPGTPRPCQRTGHAQHLCAPAPRRAEPRGSCAR